MTQHLTEEEIAICADALNLGAYRDLPAHLREHLAQCDQCAGEVLMVTEVAGEFDFKAEAEKPVKEKTQRIIAWSVSVAAAAALILLIIDQEVNPLEENQLLSKNSTTEQTIKSTDKSEQPSSGEAEIQEQNKVSNKSEFGSQNIAEDSEFPAGTAASAPAPTFEDSPDTLKFLARYTPNENMEKLVNRFKGNMRDNGDIVVKSPVSITCSGSSLVIKWENPDRKRLIIEVLDNEGKQLMEAETDQEEYTITNLSDGLYYWKLISGSEYDLLFCGKIIVE